MGRVNVKSSYHVENVQQSPLDIFFVITRFYIDHTNCKIELLKTKTFRGLRAACVVKFYNGLTIQLKLHGCVSGFQLRKHSVDFVQPALLNSTTGLLQLKFHGYVSGFQGNMSDE